MKTNGKRLSLNAEAIIEHGTCPLDLVESFYRRFIVYPSDDAICAHVLWTAHTWLMDCWDSTPRLGFVSPAPGSGKTRALEVTELFALLPRLSANMSPAAMVRIIAKARKEDESFITVLYDELDVALSKSEEGTADLRAALNAGYRRNGVFTRCINSGAGVEDFPAYAALAFSALHPEKLPDALATRTIFIGMRPRAGDEAKEDFELDTHPSQAVEICDALAQWCNDHKSRMRGRPDMPVRDRAADIWKPLVLIADAAGGDWPKRARAASVHLTGAAKAKAKTGSDVELLAHIREAFFEGDVALHSDELVRRLFNREESPWNDKQRPLTTTSLASKLKQYEIPPEGVSRQFRINGVNHNGYARSWFVDAWKRYVDAPTAPNSTASTNSTKLMNKNKSVDPVEAVEFPPAGSPPGENVVALHDDAPEPGSFEPEDDPFDLDDIPAGLERRATRRHAG